MAVSNLLIMKKSVFYPGLAALLLFFATSVYSQQQGNFLFFETNMSVFNPAYTGSQGALASLQYKSSWMGVEGGPREAALVYHSKQKNKASWGLNFQTQRVFIENQGVVSADYSYELQLGATSQLFLGVKAGGFYNQIDLNNISRITTENNPYLNELENEMYPLLGAGLLLRSKGSYFGASIPNFLNAKRYIEANGFGVTSTDKAQLFLSAGTRIPLFGGLSVLPAVLYRFVQHAPNYWSAVGFLDYQDKIALGLGLANNQHMSALLKTSILSNTQIGFAYEFGLNTSATSLRENGLEVFLQYGFN